MEYSQDRHSKYNNNNNNNNKKKNTSRFVTEFIDIGASLEDMDLGRMVRP